MESRPPAIVAVADSFGHDVEENLAQIERAVAEAREQGAELVVFPECAVTGYLQEPMPGEHAPVLPPSIRADGPEIARLCEIAGELVVIAGFSEEAAGGPFTSAICVTGDGVLGLQRKVHLPPGERFAYQAGERFDAFDTPVGRVGMLVCYDKCFPEAARALALDGAEIVACLAAWAVCRQRPARRIAQDRQTRHFNALDEARAIENQIVWVSTNMTGRLGPVRFLGNAKVVDPDGVVLARTGARPGMAVAHIDARAAVRDTRLGIDHLGDRRPAAYAGAASAVRGRGAVAAI